LDALVNLEVLDLSFNRIERIQNLNALTNLRTLYLVHNKIAKIEGLEKVCGVVSVVKG
jgi:protein phosphatase 1 regulatory subunit 7